MTTGGQDLTGVGRGTWAEDLALRHLCARGLALEARNYRCHRGEIDLVMRDGEVLVFVEVRYRAADRYGGAAETVDHRKRGRIAATAAHYLQYHPRRGGCPCRFDVVSVNGEAPAIDWIADAFQP